MNHDSYSDDYIRSILSSVKTIAIVGASAKKIRPSYFAMKYMIDKGYEVYPINPGLAGQTILDRPVYSSLKEVPTAIDMVDIFRNSEVAGLVCDEAIELGARVVWMQLTVRNDEAAKRAEQAGLQVVMNRCPKIEYGRLSGEIGWIGVNSQKISSKRPIMASKGFQHFKIKPVRRPLSN